MSDSSDCNSSLNAHELEVFGLETILDSMPLTLLFIASKEWILSLYENRTDQIENITVWNKTIGRNDGFVLDINCTDPTASTSFYAKMQPASIDTILIHHLLKNMNCGPQYFHVTPLADGDSHGVITEGVKDWTMASYLTRARKDGLVYEKKRLATTAYLLTFLIELGQFANIPRNKSNWGFCKDSTDAMSYPYMSLVDFSRSKSRRGTFNSKSQFTICWRRNLAYLFDKWQPICGDIEDLQLFQDRTADLRKSLLHDLVIEEQVQYFPFLQSRQAFVEILQSSCDQTAQWLHDLDPHIRGHRPEDVEGQNVDEKPVDFDTPTTPTILIPFLRIPPPDVSRRDVQFKSLMNEYCNRVEEWNDSAEMLFQWFPFPN